MLTDARIVAGGNSDQLKFYQSYKQQNEQYSLKHLFNIMDDDDDIIANTDGLNKKANTKSKNSIGESHNHKHKDTQNL